MKNSLYIKLAATSLKKNRKIYVPYIIIGIVMSFVFYTLRSLAANPSIYDAQNGVEGFKGAQEIVTILKIGVFVVGTFSLICILFGNSFVMKQRKKELGLYEILGIRKAGIARILCFETGMIALIVILAGTLLGISTDKFMMNMLLKLTTQENVKYTNSSFSAVTFMALLFGVIYLVVLVYNVVQIYSLDLIQILYSNKHGEREPKVKCILLIVGMLTLGLGYYLALSCNSTGKAFEVIFIAVILVIIGVYCLFVAASVAILKALKRNKRIYYKTSNYVSISNLLYRMKQNAVGLASICVISTAALLVFAAGTSLYVGGDASIEKVYPYDAKVIIKSSDYQSDEMVKDSISESAKSVKASLEETCYIAYMNTTLEYSEGVLRDFENWNGNYSTYRDVYLIPLNVYHTLSNKEIQLSDNEILYFDEVDSRKESIEFEERKYVIQGKADCGILDYIKDSSMELFTSVLIVLPDEEFMSFHTEQMLTRWLYFGANIESNSDVQNKFLQSLEKSLDHNGIEVVHSGLKVNEKADFMSIYGGIFFLGIYLGVIFLAVTTIIIYYKQISEGYEDSTRYGLLRKIGMTKKEIKACINKQVLIVFFTPVLMAIINMCVALKIVWLFLGMIIVIDLSLFRICAAIVSILFVVVYTIVYFITSRVYHNIVQS